MHPHQEKKEMKLRIHKMDKETMEIDFHNFHFSLINAYRRIVYKEVPTVCIEKVHIYNNTSSVPDEVLAHRLGLVPLDVPPDRFNNRVSDQQKFSEDTTVAFQLKVKCRGKPDSRGKGGGGEAEEGGEAGGVVEKFVTTENLVWQPLGSQKSMYSGRPLGPLREELPPAASAASPHTHIMLAKLVPGQRIDAMAYAFRGTGAQHAKFTPGHVSYRMMPKLTLNCRVFDEEARLLQRCFSPGTIRLLGNPPITDEERRALPRPPGVEAVVGDPRHDTCAHNVFRHPSLAR